MPTSKAPIDNILLDEVSYPDSQGNEEPKAVPLEETEIPKKIVDIQHDALVAATDLPEKERFPTMNLLEFSLTVGRRARDPRVQTLANLLAGVNVDGKFTKTTAPSRIISAFFVVRDTDESGLKRQDLNDYLEMVKIVSTQNRGRIQDREEAIIYLQNSAKIDLDKIAFELYSDVEVMLSALKRDGGILECVSPELKEDKDIVIAAVSQNGEALRFVSEELRGDKDVVLAAVSQNGEALRFVSEELRGDKDVVLAAVSQNGKALGFASEGLRGDRNLAIAAVRVGKGGFRCISPELLDTDRDLILELLKAGFRVPWEIMKSRNFLSDKEIVLASMRIELKEGVHFYKRDIANIRNFSILDTPVLLYYIGSSIGKGKSLLNDDEVASLAVEMSGVFLYYLSPQQQNNKTLVLKAVSNCGEALEYASDELKRDKDVVRAAITQDQNSIQYASSEVFGDGELMAIGAEHFEKATKDLKENKETVLAVVSKSGRALRHASNGLRDDKDVVLAAVSKDNRSLEYASERLRDDKDVVLAAVSKTGSSLKFASSRLKNDRDVAMTAISYGCSLGEISEALKDDRDVVIAAVTDSGEQLQYASESLRSDKSILLLAWKSLSMSRQEIYWYYAWLPKTPSALRNDPKLMKTIFEALRHESVNEGKNRSTILEEYFRRK